MSEVTEHPMATLVEMADELESAKVESGVISTKNVWRLDLVFRMREAIVKIAALEAELADLRAKVPQATQSDRGCAIKVHQTETGPTPPPYKYGDRGGELIAAHVAPIRAQLETAVGLVDTQSRHISAYHKIIDHLNARLISLDVDYFPSRQDFWETIKATKGIQENAARFLATIPTAEGENES